MKLTIATPAYGGQLDSQYVHGLVSSFLAGAVNNWLVLSTESLVPRARNQLVGQFLELDSDFLLFVDADIGFTVDDVKRAAGVNRGIVCGCYPKKVEGGGYVFNDIEEEDGDLVAVKEAGTGFMCIKRDVLEAVAADADPIVTDSGKHYWDLFPVGTDESKRYYSEDYGFCILARKAGYKIWVDRGIRLKHIGRKVYQ